MHSSTRRICLAAGSSHAGDAAPVFLPVSHFLLPFLPAQGIHVLPNSQTGMGCRGQRAGIVNQEATWVGCNDMQLGNSGSNGAC